MIGDCFSLRSWKKRLKPQDIRSKEFKKKTFGIGYDPEEIEAFLIEVANAYQELLEELEELQGIVPENNTNELMEKVRNRIEEIFREAMEKKRELEVQSRKIETEIERLKLVRERMYSRLKLVILDMTHVIQGLHPNSLEKDNK
jgi:cell division initiation protein